MAPLRLVYPARSDGVLSTAADPAKKKKPEANQPTAEQMQKRKNKGGLWCWYQELTIEDPKNLDWRRKLGGQLVAETVRQMKKKGMQPSTGPGSETKLKPEEYVLAVLPENYRLFEQCRAADPDSDDKKARGPKDRKDIYLYGHPGGRKKRFRSPAEFLPHLIWLCLDESASPEACTCKLCTPEEMTKTAERMEALQRELFNLPLEVKQEKPEVKPLDLKPAVPAPPAAAVVKAPVTTPTSANAPPTPTLASPSQPLPLPKPRDTNQHLDQQTGKFFYRLGELVWYRRNQNAFGLGLIVWRKINKDPGSNRERPSYVVQPLSHPQHHPPATRVTNESSIVPWLAFSTPPAQHAGLRNCNDLSFDAIDWNDVISGRLGDGDAEVDASIFAARTVDKTYSLVQALGPPDPQTREVEYNGIFLGGEQIWAGEAVRIHPTEEPEDKGQRPHIEIMIVSRIIDRPSTTPASVEFIGDVYRLSSMTYNPSRPLPRNHALPLRVHEDIRFRNQRLTEKQGRAQYWKFVVPQQRLSISAVKGRWYELQRLMQYIRGSEAAAMQIIEDNKGEVPDANEDLNSRGRALLDPRLPDIGIKKQDRLAAFSTSVPKGLKLGVDPLAQPTANAPQQQPLQNQRNIAGPSPPPGQLQSQAGRPNPQLAAARPLASPQPTAAASSRPPPPQYYQNAFAGHQHPQQQQQQQQQPHPYAHPQHLAGGGHPGYPHVTQPDNFAQYGLAQQYGQYAQQQYQQQHHHQGQQQGDGGSMGPHGMSEFVNLDADMDGNIGGGGGQGF